MAHTCSYTSCITFNPANNNIVKIRDLTDHQIANLERQCGKDYKNWLTSTNGGRKFGTSDPVDFWTVFHFAFSKGAQSVLEQIPNEAFTTKKKNETEEVKPGNGS